MNPYYEIKNAGDGEAEVWIYEQIGEDWFGEGVTAKAFAKELSSLKASRIALHINSPGGSVFDGQAIYNAVKRHPATVTTYVDGIAASIASVIALAGEKVVMASNALFMIHNPYGGVLGTAEDMRQMADVLDKVRGTIVGVYQEKTGREEADIEGAMDAETWLTAEEAVEFGFADEIGAEAQLAACASFDFKALGYKHAPTIEDCNEDDEPEAPGEPEARVEDEEPGSDVRTIMTASGPGRAATKKEE